MLKQENPLTAQQTGQIEVRFKVANEGRQFDVYTWRMDAALVSKVHSFISRFAYLKDGMTIVDAGSGTGRLSEAIAQHLRSLSVTGEVIALDISHEYIDISGDQPLIELAFGDASEQQFPSNSVDIKIYSTSGHEIESFGGKGRMRQAIKNSFKELKPDGQLLIRDFVRPSEHHQVFMELPQQDGEPLTEHFDGSDYTKLSTYALFLRFHQEFAGGRAFSFSETVMEGKKVISLPWEWAYEFYMRKEYRGNWKNEIHEKYAYWSLEEARQEMEAAGFVDVIIEDDSSQYMKEHWLEGKIGLYELDETGTLVPMAFPATHMMISSRKPKSFSNESTPVIDKVPETDLIGFLSSINVDEAAGIISFQPVAGQGPSEVKNVAIDLSSKVRGTKFTVYRLRDTPTHIIKIPNLPTVGTAPKRDLMTELVALNQAVDKRAVLDEYHTPHLRIVDFDPAGPPYRYLIQEALPEGAVCMADVIKKGELSETDIAAICQVVNDYEKDKKFQLDSNPFAWYRVPQSDGTTRLTYVSGKVFAYHDHWEFRKIGLLQWTNPSFVNSAHRYAAGLPTKSQQQAFATEWAQEIELYQIWRRYLLPQLQPQSK